PISFDNSSFPFKTYSVLPFQVIIGGITMKKKISRKTLLIMCLVMLVTGFFAGQFFRIPAFDDYNFINAMRRPPSNNNRR
ncbi:MAG: hypothetical protein JXR86_17560, partial [Spirochaetales bacterium]|nr:hypothetical protein [Spirochaetales bacterium]